MTSIRLSREKRYENHFIRAFFLALIERLSDQDKKGVTFLKNFFVTLDAAIKQDPHHENMAKTGMSEKQQLSAEFLPWDILLFSLLWHKYERTLSRSFAPV